MADPASPNFWLLVRPDRESPNWWLLGPATVLTAIALMLLMTAGIRAQVGTDYWGVCRQGWLTSRDTGPPGTDLNGRRVAQDEPGWLVRNLTDDRGNDICYHARDTRLIATWLVGLAGLLGLVGTILGWGDELELAFALFLSGAAVCCLIEAAVQGPTLSMGLAGLGLGLFASEAWRRWASDRHRKSVRSTTAP